MLVELIGLGEIKRGALRLVITAPAKNCCARVLVCKLASPLPYIAYQIHYTERTRPVRMCRDRIRATH